jgi:predicted Holliday junction resolvase-like endonuclease
MYRRLVIITMISLALLAALYAQRFQAQSQYPVMDKVAQKVIDKYQKSSCEDLKHQKSEAASGQDAEVKQKVVEAMRKDPQMRQEFINMVAAPIANKMFECGMIP